MSIESPPADAVDLPADIPAGAPAGPVAAAYLPTIRWLREGLRAGVFLAPRIGGARPTAVQVIVLLACTAAIGVLGARAEVNGPATFLPRAWLTEWWLCGALVLAAWWAVSSRVALEGDGALGVEGENEHHGKGQGGASGAGTWLALWLGAVLPSQWVSQAMAAAQARDLLPAALETEPVLAWGIYLLLWGWLLGAASLLAWRCGASRARAGVFTLLAAGLFALSVWQSPDRYWLAETRNDGPPPMVLSQETFEAQQAIWAAQVAALARQRPGVADVYGLVFAPYASEDVFLRESAMVEDVLRTRFEAQGRVLRLVNHASTATTLPWATPANLVRAIQALAARMDRDEDVLVVYLTSHGGGDFRLAAWHWPLEVPPVTPRMLRQALDAAGVRHRVVAISACYAGGWVGPLAEPGTLVMTAADATHTSYGCGHRSPLTFFGRAVFDEQLRRTHSFERAFAQAVPVIRQREVEGRKPDGFSNPQISVGPAVAPVLATLARRLDAAPTATQSR